MTVARLDGATRDCLRRGSFRAAPAPAAPRSLRFGAKLALFASRQRPAGKPALVSCGGAHCRPARFSQWRV